jgi:regulator of nucleoside diphosphate kinase
MAEEIRKPPIAIARSEHARLAGLADILSRRNAGLAEQLFAELERAEVVPDEDARDVIRMGSTLDYRTDRGEQRTVTLVFPGEEDIAAGKVSVLTPIGVVLIGLSAGDAMEWRTRDGRVQRLTVTRLHPRRPAPQGEASASP